MQSFEDNIICDRTKKAVCEKYCAVCGACVSVSMGQNLRNKKYLDTLEHRRKICPMYGPCPAGQYMSTYDTCDTGLDEPKTAVRNTWYTENKKKERSYKKIPGNNSYRILGRPAYYGKKPLGVSRSPSYKGY